MKTLIKLLVIVFTINTFAQTEVNPRGFDYFVSIGQDIKMAYEGPYAGKTNDIGPTFNPEFKLGINWLKWRVAAGAEFHNEIHYTKWFLEFGHKINDPFRVKNITLLAAAEVGLIRRNNQDINFTNPNHYKKNDSWGSYGVNFEIFYNIPKTIMAVSVNYNVFRAEGKDAFGNKLDKDFRQDVMLNLYIYL